MERLRLYAKYTTRPSENQTAKRSQVSQLSPPIRIRQNTIEQIGVNGTPGARNPRRASGWVLRIHRIPADTMMNADRVPMFTSSNSTLMLMKPPAMAVRMPKNHVPLNGVWYFGCTSPKNFGNNPSRLMA